MQDVEASKRMLTGRSARDANIRYLEYEARDVVSNGNLWKTYGSPVAFAYFHLYILHVES